MSKLIQMRRRIKAIETLKKVTHAMRLISMSSHSRLKSKQQFLSHYVSTVERLFAAALQSSSVQNNSISTNSIAGNSILQPAPTGAKQLVIVIGSQKGLCGNFNTMLLNKLTQISDLNNPEKTAVIIVGKKVHDTIKNIVPLTIIQTYDNFTASTFLSIAPALINAITASPYQKVVAVSTISKSFFLQVAQETTLVPLQQAFTQTAHTTDQAIAAPQDYIWEYPKEEILASLAHYYLEAHIEQLLFESLLAEQAARFISMDSSTRNAQNLLNETQLQYNKTRQAKITRDLTELASSF